MFACQAVKNKSVLDIACGEGYGSALLSQSAKSVVGVDISEEAINHAKNKYQLNNLKFKLGSCSKIPLEDNSVDVVVSFETIEHHDEHELMMVEVKRVLRADGILIISSPNKEEYSDKPEYDNPFHIKELSSDDFKQLLSKYFTNTLFYGQRILYGSAIFSNECSAKTKSYHINEELAGEVSGIIAPLFSIAIASNRTFLPVDCGFFEQTIEDSPQVKSKEAMISTLSLKRDTLQSKNNILQSKNNILQSQLGSLGESPRLLKVAKKIQFILNKHRYLKVFSKIICAPFSYVRKV